MPMGIGVPPDAAACPEEELEEELEELAVLAGAFAAGAGAQAANRIALISNNAKAVRVIREEIIAIFLLMVNQTGNGNGSSIIRVKPKVNLYSADSIVI